MPKCATQSCTNTVDNLLGEYCTDCSTVIVQGWYDPTPTRSANKAPTVQECVQEGMFHFRNTHSIAGKLAEIGYAKIVVHQWLAQPKDEKSRVTIGNFPLGDNRGTEESVEPRLPKTCVVCGQQSIFHLCNKHALPGMVVECGRDKFVISTWLVQRKRRKLLVTMNDFTLGDFFGGREGFERKLRCNAAD